MNNEIITAEAANETDELVLQAMSKEQLVVRCTELMNREQVLPGAPRYMRGPGGYMVWQEQPVQLSVDDGTIENIWGVGHVISALGWARINEVLRVAIYNDPHVETIRENGKAVAVRVQGAAVGCIGGVPQVTTLSLTYNFQEMFLRELLKLADKKWGCAKAGSRGRRPVGENDWVFYELAGEAGVWVDVAHKEVRDKIATLLGRRKLPDRTAFTFLRRNLTKQMSGGMRQKCAGATDTRLVRGYYYPLSRERMEAIAAGALRGEQVDDEVQLITAGAVTVDDPDEVIDIEAEEVDNETSAAPVPQGPAPVEPATQLSPAQVEILADMGNGWRILSRENRAALKAQFPGPFEERALYELQMIDKKIKQLADAQAQQGE